MAFNDLPAPIQAAIRTGFLERRFRNALRANPSYSPHIRDSLAGVASRVDCYWLMLKLRDAIPKPQPLATAEFITLRLRLLKVAARVTEAATRVRLAFAAACPEAALFASLSRCMLPAGP